MTKAKLIQAIIDETKMDAVKWYDFLEDKPKSYLEKFLKIIKQL